MAIKSLLLILALATAVCAQTTSNYGFVSPNTKENLKLDDAIRGMNSREETTLVKQSINMGCVVRSRIRAFRSLGSWTDGAEHSVMIRVESDEPTVRYVLSRLGRDAQQKSILYFHPQAAGTADLYTLKPHRPIRNLAALAQSLDRAGIETRRYFWPPLHQLPAYRGRCSLPVTDAVGEAILCLPMHSRMDPAVLDRIEDALRQAARAG